MGQNSIHEDSNQGRKKSKDKVKLEVEDKAERNILVKIEDK